jgi:hypothetical protein
MRTISDIDACLRAIDASRETAVALVRELTRVGETDGDGDSAELLPSVRAQIESYIRAQRDRAVRVDAAVEMVMSEARVRGVLDAEEGEAVRGKGGGRKKSGADSRVALEEMSAAFNERGAVSVEIVDGDGDRKGDEHVCVRAEGAFEARWDAKTCDGCSVRACNGETASAAHAAFTERAMERLEQGKETEKNVVEISRMMIEWFEGLHDVFTAPDPLNGGKVLAADCSRGNVLIPSRLLPGR